MREEILKKANLQQLHIIASFDDDLAYKNSAYVELLRRRDEGIYA